VSDGSKGGWRETLVTWGPAILAVIFIRSTLASPFRIPSGSMVPTLEIGDHILVSKLSYGLHVPWLDLAHGPGFLGLPFTTVEVMSWDDPERGDIVVFKYPPEPAVDYIKRVVGLPGDTVEVRDNVLVLNGVAQDQEYEERYTFTDDGCDSHPTRLLTEDLMGAEHQMLTSTGRSTLSNYGPVTVPDGHYFMMGDNRDHSADSRVWGYVPREYMRGKAKITWFSGDTCAGGPPFFGKPRLSRLGMTLE